MPYLAWSRGAPGIGTYEPGQGWWSRRFSKSLCIAAYALARPSTLLSHPHARIHAHMSHVLLSFQRCAPCELLCMIILEPYGARESLFPIVMP